MVNFDGVHAALLRFAELRRGGQAVATGSAIGGDGGGAAPAPSSRPAPAHVFACDIKAAFDVILPQKMAQIAGQALQDWTGDNVMLVRGFAVLSPDGPVETETEAGAGTGAGVPHRPGPIRTRRHKLVLLESEQNTKSL